MRKRAMRRAVRPWPPLAAAMALGLTAALLQPGGLAQAAPRPSSPATKPSKADTDWRKSADRALETNSDKDGYHLSVADGGTAFAWRPLATIRPAGFDTDAWTGYSCMTGSGNDVVSVVAPASFANSPVMRDRGAFAYVTDVATGTVHPIVSGVALKYYSPGCGAGDTAVLTRNLGTEQESTQLVTLDAARASIRSTVTVGGQITSAVPGPSGTIVAASGPKLVRIDSRGRQGTLALGGGQVYDVVSGPSHTAFLATSTNQQSRVFELTGASVRQIAHGPAGGTHLFNGRHGRALLTGPVQVDAKSETALADTKLPANVDGVSLDGQVVLGRPAAANAGAHVDVRSTATGGVLEDSSELGQPAAAAATALPRTTMSATGPKALAAAAAAPTCAVPRNVATAMAPQPSRAQVERAVDLAVSNNLLDARPANYLNMGLASYSADGDFGKRALSDGGSVPAQVFLGVLAQESNMEQASWHALPGIAANPLIGDYYGSGDTTDVIDYSKADCGYGIGQVTTGMRAADASPYSTNGKTKIAVDYEENIAAGLQILSDKWNQLATLGVKLNDGSSKYIENWYAALWAYNTGIQPDAAHGNTTGCTPSPSCTDTLGDYGLGWANNPVNPDYPPGRDLFLRATYADAEHPADWPYQERVMGWIEYPQRDLQGAASYSLPTYGSASPNNPAYRLNLPSSTQYSTFCNVALDNCDPTDTAHQYCGFDDATSSLYDHCWWHSPATWLASLNSSCVDVCATEHAQFAAGSADPGSPDPHPADCSSRLPSSAVIVDEEPTDLNNAGCGSNNWTSSGSFGLTYGADSSGNSLGVIDTHQLGAGFGGRLLFTHNVANFDTGHVVTGTWTASLPTHLYNVYAHMPSTGGTTASAHYQVRGDDGTLYERVASQHTNEDQWASLGDFQLGSNAQVTLNNVTDDSSHKHDVAFDAIGFVPVSGTFQHRTFDAVSVFDPGQNLDTNTPSQFDTPMRSRQTLYDWAVGRTAGGPQWDDSSAGTVRGLTQIPQCTGTTSTACLGGATLSAANDWRSQVLAAGTSTTGAMTEPMWMGYANPRPDVTADPDTAFASDLSYKIKTHMDVSFAVDGSGGVVPGSEGTDITVRTGDTAFPPFVRAFMKAVAQDYGVPAPDFAYDEVDANLYTGDPTAVADPLQTGFLPARAYLPHTWAPTIDGSCVTAESVTGGADAFRPLDGQAQTDTIASNWVNAVKQLTASGKAPAEVGDTAGDIYSIFFRKSTTLSTSGPGGALYNFAPPIWQLANLKFCADGSVQSNQVSANADDSGSKGLAYQSYMPDLYLYIDGKMVDNQGGAATGPAQKGDWATFSNLPVPLFPSANGYDLCDIKGRGNGGNPWDISAPETPADYRPYTVTGCTQPAIYYGDDTP